ncbi:hypothetical protein AMTRI_Chr01g112460 [Amborella trichopoda]
MTVEALFPCAVLLIFFFLKSVLGKRSSFNIKESFYIGHLSSECRDLNGQLKWPQS